MQNENFKAPDPVYAVTSAQMRAIEAAAIGAGRVTGQTLMERAGRGVVAAVRERLPEPGQALVLCGPGSNGGDGYVIARHLAGRGWRVEVLAWGDPAQQPPDARAMRDAWNAFGPVGALAELGDAGPDGSPDLIVDALFGIGLTRPLPEKVGQVLQGMGCWRERRRVRPLIVAVDLPSGLCADTGRALGRVLPAGLTVTFHARKPGHLAGEGPALCGHVVVVDIGLPPASS